jgi:hypothetical protein
MSIDLLRLYRTPISAGNRMYGLMEYVYPGRFYNGFIKSVINTRTITETPNDTMCHFGVSFALKALRRKASGLFPPGELFTFFLVGSRKRGFVSPHLQVPLFSPDSGERSGGESSFL